MPRHRVHNSKLRVQLWELFGLNEQHSLAELVQHIQQILFESCIALLKELVSGIAAFKF